ncbi:MAG: AAA family ATPase, partial [Candidatus Dojkabacteria bacterium]
MTEFIDRFKEVEEVCKPVDEDNRLLIIYGESGVGKTSLLEKALEDIKQHYPDPEALAFIVNFESFASEANQRASLLRTMAQESGGVLNYGVWRNEEQAAGQMIARLNEVVAKRPVYLMFDTTEVLQENTEFWEWMQKYIVEPLVVEGEVKQIFAGRVPAPLRRGEVGNAR